MIFFLSIIFISCKDKTFENLVFENIAFIYDGLEKEIVVKNAPEGAVVEYRPNNKYTEVGIYEVYAYIDVCDNSESLFEIFKERANELKD